MGLKESCFSIMEFFEKLIINFNNFLLMENKYIYKNILLKSPKRYFKD